MSKVLSIILTHWNRKQQLINTLHSINYFRKDYNLDVIVVDDVSDESIDDIIRLFPFSITLVKLNDENRKNHFHEPVTAYNKGFRHIQGDMVLISCAECLHVGNIIDYIFKYLQPNQYFNFSTYSINYELFQKINNINWQNKPIDSILNIIGKTHPMENWEDGTNGWYVHSLHRNTLLAFCGAMYTSDLEKLSGYDERFCNGISCADNDLSDRIVNAGMSTHIIDDPFCIHQWHTPTYYEENLTNINRNMYFYLKDNYPNRIKANTNKIYIK